MAFSCNPDLPPIELYHNNLILRFTSRTVYLIRVNMFVSGDAALLYDRCAVSTAELAVVALSRWYSVLQMKQH